LFSLLSFSLQVSASYYAAPGSLGHSAAIVTLPHLQHHVSAYMYVRSPKYTGGSRTLPSPRLGPIQPQALASQGGKQSRAQLPALGSKRRSTQEWTWLL